MTLTKWWKCDLQIATPAWQFRMPTDQAYDLATPDGKRQFADRYMDELIRCGIESIVLADHNTGDWIDVMLEAGGDRGITVFPGCEITTGSGADGIHLVIIGDREKTSHDFDLLLAGPLGFDHEHGRYHLHGEFREPGSSGKTILKILDDLPDDYLAIAPHALNDNGIASGRTVKGDIRWKALHHPRLEAVDPGDCVDCDSDSFNDLFRRRSLDNFPRLRDLAFIATSDAYDFGRFGARFCWVRMEQPTLEALRQAFLDHEARIMCHWDSRLNDYPDRNPNKTRHAWIETVELGGVLGNSSAPLTLDFHPALNVVIGGRGSGKSTVVAALRQIYSGFNTLPEMVKEEAEIFSDRIFEQAELSSIHRIQNSQDRQHTKWTKETGSQAQQDDGPFVPTNFRVRVVNQKELFERVSQDRDDPLSASRSFLAFVDESLGLLKTEPARRDSWWRKFDDAAVEWRSATREHERLKGDLGQLPSIRAKVKELEAQLAAFDSPEAKSRREYNQSRVNESELLDSASLNVYRFLQDLSVRVDQEKSILDLPDVGADIQSFTSSLKLISQEVSDGITNVLIDGERSFADWHVQVQESEWHKSLLAARADEEVYLGELKAKGIDPDSYNQLKKDLTQQQGLEKSLAALESSLDSLRDRTAAVWSLIQSLLRERRSLRSDLLGNVSQRSGRLKFELRPHRDVIGWCKSVRNLLNLRADAFLEDVPDLAEWIWNAPDDVTRENRWSMWRTALSRGNFDQISDRDNADLRANWRKRLETLDETVRLRLATEIADDIAKISFLKDSGNPETDEDWQDITQGSPGQRTAAMLGFVLHHGDEPLILDQPEDDLDTEWISKLVVQELRASRWKRQIIVVTHNANIPVNGDAERVIVLENEAGVLRIRQSSVHEDGRLVDVDHTGAIEMSFVREDIQNIMEGGIRAFIQRERKYNNEVRTIVMSDS